MTLQRLRALSGGLHQGGGGEAQDLKLFQGLVSVWMTTGVGEGRLLELQVGPTPCLRCPQPLSLLRTTSGCLTAGPEA